MLSLAGASAYVWSWKIGIAVCLVMAVVVASYRQNVHAYPSGGGDYEVATVNLGAAAGTTVASALLVDYVMTVAVSISSGAQYAASAIDGLSGHEATFATILVILLAAVNLRGIRESGHLLRAPDLRLHGRHPRHVRLRDAPAARRQPARRRERRPGHRAGGGPGRLADHRRADVPAGQGLLLRLRRTHRRRGDLERGASVQAPEEQERRHHAADAGRDRHHDDAQRDRARERDGAQVRRSPRPRPAHARRAAAARRLRPAHRDRADRQGGVHRLPARLLLRRHRDRRDPGAGGQHGVQRLPGPGLDPRPGRLCASSAGLARRPAGLQQRHRLPGPDGDHPDPGLRRRGHPADPALHRRRLRLLQPQPARHDPALDPVAEGRAGSRRSGAG